MRAVFFDFHGGPDVLGYREAPDPEPAEGQVLVRVEAVGVNYRDVYERAGAGYGSPPPAVLGAEGAGTVVDTGERVAWVAVPGSYAELVAAPREQLVPVPDGVGSDVAAASLLQGITAQYLCADSYPVQPGDWVIVHAAAGGVGLLLTQLVKARGGRVIATTSNEEKAALARKAGADEVLGYEGFADRAREITGGEGVAAVYDGIGRTTFSAGLTALRPTGSMIIYGAASGAPEPVHVSTLQKLGSLYVQRPTMNTYLRTPEMLQTRARQVLDLVARGDLDVRIGARYPLEQARQAHEDLEARKTTGKLLLVP
ncbi:quinone oxidoreductase [Geodermatophilus sp. YIM 151500]|uniref:quinone oxidoreductase family protein n=1 Tax=Geodermatophilus sp. YIM 151500 TaxID=2984531 RepID=UPI0021E3E4B5|nr:quinone oxidoreductase [Geodermatophilus sp. YIM 151500]MCV2487817.1 quinone oxidoreductase [Geodermatophilus sp. YIM 151500]